MGGEGAEVEDVTLQAHVLEVAQAGDIDERGCGFDAALKLDEDICASGDYARLTCVLMEEAEGFF
jgi:hypothetical protein